ncbi:hypothetical protein GCM10027615_39080 [Plantactinospora veratri]
MEESGTQTSGTAVTAPLWPTPASPTPYVPASAAATSAGSASLTATVTQGVPASVSRWSQAEAADRTAPAISGVAATVSVTCPVQPERASCWYPTDTPDITATTATATAMAPTLGERRRMRWRPDTGQY